MMQQKRIARTFPHHWNAFFLTINGWKKIDAVIREKYGLPPVMYAEKYADLIMLATERRDLGLDDGSFWPVLEGIPATEMFT